MKKTIVLLFVTIFSTNFIVSAQTKEDKALKKEWAKKMKDLDPLDYKKLVEDKDALSSQVTKLSSQVAESDSKIAAKAKEVQDKEFELADSKAENASLKAELEAAKNSASSANAAANSMAMGGNNAKGGTTTTSTSRGTSAGVVFKVQIGSFKNKDLSKYFENNKNFSGEVDADGTKKYTLGNFSEYWEADNFKKYIREMGVKDAWIVPYKNGQRVNIKDVLEGAI